MKPAACAENDVLTHNTVRPDFALGANLRPGMNDGGGVDHGKSLNKLLTRIGSTNRLGTPALAGSGRCGRLPTKVGVPPMFAQRAINGRVATAFMEMPRFWKRLFKARPRRM
jgi:hypothetical protein